MAETFPMYSNDATYANKYNPARTTQFNHTVDELWADVPEDQRHPYIGIRPIRLVVDDYVKTIPQDQVSEQRLSTAWETYSRVRAINKAAYHAYPVTQPRFARWIDRVRFKLHILLIRCKVII